MARFPLPAHKMERYFFLGGMELRRHSKTIGRIVMCCGVMVILSLVLPTSFWWFVLGMFLICVGVTIMRHC